MKRIIQILLVACCLLPRLLFADNARQQTKDSLLRVYLASPPDTTRLKTLHKIALLDQISPTFIYYQNKLLEEAIAQKNLHYQSVAIFGHVVYYYNKFDQKHAVQWIHKLEQLAEKNGYYLHYFKGKKMLIEFYIINQKIELALQEAQNMYRKAEKLNNRDGMREACLCLLTGYFNTLRYKEGIAALDKAFELTGPDASLIDRMDLLNKAVLAYSQLRDNEKLHHYLLELEKIKDSLVNENRQSNGFKNLNLMIEVHYALYYSRTQQPEKAWEHLQQSEEYLSESSFVPYKLLRFMAYAEYYQLTKEYEKALAHLDGAIRLVTPISPEDAYTYGLQKADLLVKIGCPEKALPLYHRITKAKDSLFAAFSASQIEQIQTIYNMDKLILQKEQRQAMFYRICLFVSLVIIIVLIVFNMRMYSNRKRLEQDEKEMRRLAAIAEDANEVKTRFLANMSYNIRIPLNNVVGFSQLLSTDTDLSEGERLEYSSIIQSNSSTLIQLVNDVLDLSRLEAKMMKFQLQDCAVDEWYNDLGCMVQMRSEGAIRLETEGNASGAQIHTDVNRLNQIVLSMLLYPEECRERREVKITLERRQEENEICCRIENSPLADPGFTGQRVPLLHRINQLFFEHFGGTYRMESGGENGVGTLIFTYPTLA